MLAYPATIFLGAFLLFNVQLLIGKFILPWFGGSPSVWTTCMLFFQVLLLAGYAYAHLTTACLKPRAQVIVHGILLVLAMACLPVTPSAAWKPQAGHDPVLRILLLLSASVGLPFFVLASTSPLMQRWFSLALPGRSPYRLYAVSNLGSLLGLLSYPFLIEPILARQAQASLWSSGLVLFFFSAAFAGAQLWRAPAHAAPQHHAAAEEAHQAPPGPRVQLFWIVLPALASLMLLATTNKLCLDVAVVPFLWVLPLSLYLLSFMICFQGPGWYSRLWMSTALALALAAAAITLKHGGIVPLLGQLLIFCAALFFCSMVCHGEVARLIPHPRYLTRYYLLIALGGAIGSLLVAVVAPVLLNREYELQIGLALSALLSLPLFAFSIGQKRTVRPAWLIWAVCGFAFVAVSWQLIDGIRSASKRTILSRRNFYGVLSIEEFQKEVPAFHYYLLRHGRITHGAQFVSSVSRRLPTTYYGENTGVGLALRYFHPDRPRRIGLVGLGAGTLATYGKAGDYLRFYEINSLVTELATSRFKFLEECLAQKDIALGDARLSMESEPSQQFDILVLDAFSSDAIPVHLLTQEAVAVYQRHLKTESVLAVHISNQYLDLWPVVKRLADVSGYSASLIEDRHRENEPWLSSSSWVLLTKDRSFLEREEVRHLTTPARSVSDRIRLWTDDYTSLFPIISWRRPRN